jgi:hypothetical protein
MRRVEFSGLVLVIAGMLILIGYSLWVFLTIENVPLVVRIGIVGILLGIAVILTVLVIERLRELRGERSLFA